MKAIVSGATGAVGMALVRALSECGAQTLVICRPGSQRNDRLRAIPGIEIIECDLQNIKKMYPANDEKYDAFFHLAWAGTTGNTRNDMHLQNKNVEYTLDAVDLASRFGCSVFVGAGSQAEYGRFEGKLSSCVPTNPDNGYGMAKLCAGRMSRVKCSQLGIRHVWARILSVYGPYDTENSMVMSTINKLLSGQIPEFTPAEQMWDYMYSEDAAQALIALAKDGKDGGVYCLGTGVAAPLRTYIERIRDELDASAELGIGKLPYFPNQVMYLCADMQEIKNDTGFVPRFSFDEGIAKTVEWVRNNTSIYAI